MLQSYGMSFIIIFEKTGTSSCSFYSSKKYTFLQYKKRQTHAPGTTFSTFSDEVRLEGGHGNCYRFAILTGVHQEAHICLAKLWVNGKSSETEQNYGMSNRKNLEVEVVPVDLIAKSAFFCEHCNTGDLLF